MKISKDPNKNWNNDSIQFPRMIAEMDAMGAFTPEILHELRDSMDLEFEEISALIERAQQKWDNVKAQTNPHNKIMESTDDE